MATSRSERAAPAGVSQADALEALACGLVAFHLQRRGETLKGLGIGCPGQPGTIWLPKSLCRWNYDRCSAGWINVWMPPGIARDRGLTP